jgi:hypothetical protein
MARVKSIISLRGKIGDTVFVRRNGQTIAGLPGGASRNKIMTAPEFANTRKNMMEFGGCAQFAKWIYIFLGTSIFNTVRSKTSMRQMTAILRNIQQAYADPSELFGQRTIMLYETLKGFQFNSKNVFSSIFSAPYTQEVSIGGDTLTITPGAINPATDMVIPAGATHFKLFVGWAQVANSVYNEITGKFDAPTSKGYTVQESAFLPTTEATPTPDPIIALIPGMPAFDVDDKLIGTFGISFYKEIGGEYNKMFELDAMEVVEIYKYTI